MGDTCLPWHNAQLDKSETTHLTQAGIEDQRNARATHRSVFMGEAFAHFPESATPNNGIVQALPRSATAEVC